MSSKPLSAPVQQRRAAAVDEATQVRRQPSPEQPDQAAGRSGRLEPLAAQVCAVFHTLHPTIERPVALVFAGDHGVADRGVSAYPRVVTTQMVMNFLSGGAAISVLAKAQGIDLWIVTRELTAICLLLPDSSTQRCGVAREIWSSSRP